jgi:predicted nucleic acid-binding protein
MMFRLDECLKIFLYFTLEDPKHAASLQLLSSVSSTLSFQELNSSRVVYEEIFRGQKSRADVEQRGTRHETSDKCVYYQIKI